MQLLPESVKVPSDIQLASLNVDDDEERQDEEKGFAGLSSMVSDVDDIVTRPPKQPQKASSEPLPSSKKPTSNGGRPAKRMPSILASQTNQVPAQLLGGSSAVKWVFGVALIISLLWIANQSDNHRSSKATYSSRASSAPGMPISNPASVPSQVPSRLSEDIPPVGRDKRNPVSTPASKSSRPTPDVTEPDIQRRLMVLAIQRRLNELGYSAGTPDGLFGDKTRAAILAFQLDNDITADGVASSGILARLNNTRVISGSSHNAVPKKHAW